ncbi:OsmC family protein [Candidatus Phytoplasma melaleucae]|uniref:OsmC family protein n=1 Tax=Candidatus Phytoplasma melaleucae TaxID=2982630 RepID=A0ABT9DEM8_9MOLU|nr:OsmC family protein ['Melaleuca sp.' phytoplasma]MDO8168244.1 OsmC family protein ['Melaleuca sp.' phytoplasma]
MSQTTIIAYHEHKLNSMGIIKNNLKTKLVSALLHNDANVSDPKELFCLSLVICFYKTITKYLKTNNNLSNEVKVKVVCNSYKDDEGFYFAINLICGIQHLSLEQTQLIINKVHRKCPISRMLQTYPHIKLLSTLYEEIN